MVKLRLTRTGKKHAAHYRIIAIQPRTKRDGDALEYLGYYNPRTNPSTFDLKTDRIKYWLGQGAQPTDTVRGLLIKSSIIEKPKSKKKFTIEAGNKSKERTKEKNSKKAEKSEE